MDPADQLLLDALLQSAPPLRLGIDPKFAEQPSAPQDDTVPLLEGLPLGSTTATSTGSSSAGAAADPSTPAYAAAPRTTSAQRASSPTPAPAPAGVLPFYGGGGEEAEASKMVAPAHDSAVIPASAAWHDYSELPRRYQRSFERLKVLCQGQGRSGRGQHSRH